MQQIHRSKEQQICVCEYRESISHACIDRVSHNSINWKSFNLNVSSLVRFIEFSWLHYFQLNSIEHFREQIKCFIRRSTQHSQTSGLKIRVKVIDARQMICFTLWNLKQQKWLISNAKHMLWTVWNYQFTYLVTCG